MSEEVPFIPNERTQSIFATKNYIRLEVLSLNNFQFLDADPPSFQFLFSTQAFMLAYQLFHYNKTLKTFFEILSKELWREPDKDGYFYAIYNYKSLTEGALLLASAYHILPMLQAADQIIMNAIGKLNMPTNLTVRFAPQRNEEAVCKEYFAAPMVRTFDSSYEAISRYRLLKLATSFSKAEKEMIQMTMTSYFQIWRLAKENHSKHSGWSEQYCFIHTFPLDVTSAFGTFQEKDLPCNPPPAAKQNKEAIVPTVEPPKGVKPALGLTKSKKYLLYGLQLSDHPPGDAAFVVGGVIDPKDPDKFTLKETSWYKVPTQMLTLTEFFEVNRHLLTGISRIVYFESYRGDIRFDGTPEDVFSETLPDIDQDRDLCVSGNVIILLKSTTQTVTPVESTVSAASTKEEPAQQSLPLTVEVEIAKPSLKIDWKSVWHE